MKYIMLFYFSYRLTLSHKKGREKKPRRNKERVDEIAHWKRKIRLEDSELIQTPETAVSLQNAVKSSDHDEKLPKSKNAINIAYHQRCIRHKFKKSEEFIGMIKNSLKQSSKSMH